MDEITDAKSPEYLAFRDAVTAVATELAQAIVGNGWGLLELRPMRVSLEEIFLSLTTEEAPAAAAEEPAHA